MPDSEPATKRDTAAAKTGRAVRKTRRTTSKFSPEQMQALSAQLEQSQSDQAALEPYTIAIDTDAPPELIQLAKLLQNRAKKLQILNPEDYWTPLDDEIYLRLRLKVLTDLISTAKNLRRALVVESVKTDKISRIEAGRILGVHQSTVAQWVREDTAKPE